VRVHEAAVGDAGDVERRALAGVRDQQFPAITAADLARIRIDADVEALRQILLDLPNARVIDEIVFAIRERQRTLQLLEGAHRARHEMVVWQPHLARNVPGDDDIRMRGRAAYRRRELHVGGEKRGHAGARIVAAGEVDSGPGKHGSDPAGRGQHGFAQGGHGLGAIQRIRLEVCHVPVTARVLKSAGFVDETPRRFRACALR